MRSEDTWRRRYNRPFTPKPYPPPAAPPADPPEPPHIAQRTPGLDALAAWLRELRLRLRG